MEREGGREGGSGGSVSQRRERVCVLRESITCVWVPSAPFFVFVRFHISCV